MTINLKPILDWIGNNLLVILIGVPTLIQIAPIKINPWSAILNWLSKALTNNACSKLDGLITKIGNLEITIDNNEKDRIRWEILSFATSCRNQIRHSRDEYQHIVDLNDKYKELLKKTNDSNGVFDIEFKYIKDLYEEHLAKNDFP